MGRLLCRLDEIPDGEGRGFELAADEAESLAGGIRDVFVVRRGRCVYGYVNSCPHTGTPLDLIEDQFMTRDKARILCATHGAEFIVEDGSCVGGPCQGDRLQPLVVALRDGEVRLA